MTTEKLLSHTAEHLPHLDGASLSPIEKGGSARKFYRVSSPGGTAVLVHDLGEREENRHYAALAGFLASHRVPVPGVLAERTEEGLLWLQDLGERDLWFSRDEPWEIRRPLYESALRGIAMLHRIGAETAEREGLHLQLAFDERLYRWEQQYFTDHCLGDLFGIPGETRAALMEHPAMHALAAGLAARPRRLVHRDFQSQNILIRDGEAVFIDFQGMRPGLPQYDLASLLLDPYVTLAPEEREHLLAYYRGLGNQADPADPTDLTDPAGFERVFWQCAAQRLMQALGAYGNLSLNLGKPHFRAHVVPALANLREALSRLHPEDRLDSLGKLLESLPSDP